MAGRNKFSIEDAFQFDDDDSSLRVYGSTTENIPLTPPRDAVESEHGRLADSGNSRVHKSLLLLSRSCLVHPVYGDPPFRSGEPYVYVIRGSNKQTQDLFACHTHFREH